VHRRAERFLEFETVVRAGLERCPESQEGRLVLAVGLLDQGRIAEARAEFDRLTAAILAEHGISAQAPDTDVSEDEFDAAFDAAETDNDALIDPNRIAEEAVESVDRAASEGLPEGDAIETGSAFATESMAALLAEQGDLEGAERIRQSLLSPSDVNDSAESERRVGLIHTLERWLSNIRGESR
jgi:hypothetical protein